MGRRGNPDWRRTKGPNPQGDVGESKAGSGDYPNRFHFGRKPECAPSARHHLGALAGAGAQSDGGQRTGSCAGGGIWPGPCKRRRTGASSWRMWTKAAIRSPRGSMCASNPEWHSRDVTAIRITNRFHEPNRRAAGAHSAIGIPAASQRASTRSSGWPGRRSAKSVRVRINTITARAPTGSPN